MNEEERTPEEEIEFLNGQIRMLNGAIEGWRSEVGRLQAVVDAVERYANRSPFAPSLTLEMEMYDALHDLRALDGER